jgi:hypothetical protein
MKKILIILSLLFSSNLFGQGFTYSYVDPCSKKQKVINITGNQNVTVNYLGFIGSFSQTDFVNGTFDNWITSVQVQGANQPCDEMMTQTQTTQNMIITQNIIATLTSITAASTMSVSSVGNSISNSVDNASSNNSSSSRRGSSNKQNNGTNQSNNTSSGTVSNGSTTQNGTPNTTGNSGGGSTNGGGNSQQGETTNQNGGNTSSSGNSTQGGSGQTQPSVNNPSNNNSSQGNTQSGTNTGQSGGGNTQSGTNTGQGGGGNTQSGTNPTDKPKQETTGGGGGGTTNSVANAAESSSGNGGGSKVKVGSIIGTGDIVALRSNEDGSNQFKGTMSVTKSNTNNTKAKGFLLNFTTTINNTNLTFYGAFSNKKKTNTLIVANSSMIDFEKNLFNTSTAMNSKRFGKLTMMGGLNMTVGVLAGEGFSNLSAIGGGFMPFKASKKLSGNILMLGVYSPFTKFYDGKWWDSGILLVPFSSWDYTISKSFKYNVSISSTYQVKGNVLNYQILTGAKILL